MAAHQLLFLSGLAALALSGKAPSAPVDFKLLNEYGLRTVDHTPYVDSAGCKMLSDAYHFASSEGAHAAYLYLRPQGAVGSQLAAYSEVSGRFGQTYASLAGGITVLARNNYIFRFRGSAPSTSALRAMLDHLPGLDQTDPPIDECCGYMVESSERILLGPISLAKFAARVPPGAAGFSLGGRGRVARFETPSGAMIRIVFEYPSQAIAEDRLRAFRALPGARAKIADRRLGIIFDTANAEQADELLADISPYVPMRFDPVTDLTDGPMTLDDAMASTCSAWTLGSLIATIRFLTHRREGIPDRTIALHIANP